MRTIFDVVKDQEFSQKSPKERTRREEEENYFRRAKDVEIPEKLSKIRSVLSAAPKGFIEETREQLRKIPLLGSGLQELQGTALSISPEESEKQLEKYLPTRDEFLERGLRRGGKIAPYALGGPGAAAGKLIGAGISGLLGETAKSAGLGETGQTISEMIGLSLPSLAKKIIPSAAQKPWVDFGRKMGMTEEQIAPLIQSEKKISWLSKLSPKRGRAAKKLKESKAAVDSAYDALGNSTDASMQLSSKATQNFFTDFFTAVKSLPSGVRNLVLHDFHDLMKSPGRAKDFMNFYKDINHYIGKGERSLGILKDPLKKAIESVSPQLASDFNMVNKLYENYFKIARNMRPGLFQDLMSMGRAGRVLIGFGTGNYHLMAEAIGETAAKVVARELLINPRFQNIHKKILIAMNEKKFALANKLISLLKTEAEKKDPEKSED